jgi:hypothetical protein
MLSWNPPPGGTHPPQPQLTEEESRERVQRETAEFQYNTANARAGRGYRAGEAEHRSTARIVRALDALMAEFPPGSPEPKKFRTRRS